MYANCNIKNNEDSNQLCLKITVGKYLRIN